MTGHLPSDTSIGRVRLKTANLDRALHFYAGLLGLHIRDRGEQPGVVLTAHPTSDTGLIILEEHPHARPKPPRTTGLYHFALLMPNRRELARLLKRLAQAGWPFQGFSDHGVSEAVYLADPEGNGIELYADRPREQWPRRNGRLAMYTRPLDLQNLLAELEARPETDDEPPVHPETRMGHIHLHVSDLGKAENFYSRLLGFDVTERNYPGALFLSAGGYHHHLGVNIWAGPGAPPPPEDAAGLLDFAIVIPDAGAAQRTVDRLRSGGVAITETGDRQWRTKDPDGTGVLIIAGLP